MPEPALHSLICNRHSYSRLSRTRHHKALLRTPLERGSLNQSAETAAGLPLPRRKKHRKRWLQEPVGNSWSFWAQWHWRTVLGETKNLNISLRRNRRWETVKNVTTCLRSAGGFVDKLLTSDICLATHQQIESWWDRGDAGLRLMSLHLRRGNQK